MSPDLPALAKFAVLALIVTSVGRKLAALLVPSSTSDERRWLAFPLGMALLSLATAGLLFARLPGRNGLAVLLAAGVLWARAEIREGLRGVWDWLAEFRNLAWPGLLFRGLVLGVAAFGVIGCLAPETGMDTGVYHFATARLRAEEGRMVVRPDQPFGYMPATMETLSTAGFLLHGESLASLITFGFYFAGLALTCLWARAAGGERASLLAGFAYLSSATFILRTGGGDVEVGQAVCFGLALYALLRVREGGAKSWLGVAGLGFGLMLGIKYASAWFVLATAVAWLGVRRRDGIAWRELLMECSVLAGVGGIVASPWYVRNLLVTGNAIAPFGAASTRSPWSDVLAVFWPQALQGLWFDGFALAGLGVAGLAAARAWRWVLVAIAVAVAGIFVNLALVPSPYTHLGGAPRYVSPAFLPLFVAAGIAVDQAWSKPAALRLAALGLLAAWTVNATAIHGYRNARKAAVALGRESRDAFLERRVNSYWAMRRAERELPSGKKVLLAETRTYYCPVPFLHVSDLQPVVRFDSIDTPRRLREFLDLHSIGLIVANEAPDSRTWGFKNLVARLGASLPDAGVEVVERRDRCTLYRVRN